MQFPVVSSITLSAQTVTDEHKQAARRLSGDFHSLSFFSESSSSKSCMSEDERLVMADECTLQGDLSLLCMKQIGAEMGADGV